MAAEEQGRAQRAFFVQERRERLTAIDARGC